MLKNLFCLPGKKTIENNSHRLMLLENAVINYGGGIVHLESEVRGAAESLNDSEPETAQLLNDVVRYLRDVAKAGELDIDDWQEPPHKRSKHV